MRQRITTEAINKVLAEIQDDMKNDLIDGNAIWKYITDNTNLIKLSETTDYDQMDIFVFSAFFAGIKSGLESIRLDEGDLVNED